MEDRIVEYNRRAKEIEATMPVLAGSEKQIAWANKLRLTLLVNIEARKMDMEDMPDAYKMPTPYIYKFEKIKNESNAGKVIDILK
jgi:hypothetical protein